MFMGFGCFRILIIPCCAIFVDWRATVLEEIIVVIVFGLPFYCFESLYSLVISAAYVVVVVMTKCVHNFSLA
jgi:hypothetical protein